MEYTDFFSEVRSKANIVDIVSQFVPLKKQNKEFIGLCPFHQEKTPSFKVNPVKNFYHCFGCQAHGDVISFLAKNTGFPYKEAAIKIANDYGIPIPKLSFEQQKKNDESEVIYNTLEVIHSVFSSEIRNHDEAISYLKKRGLSFDIIQKFDIGFAKIGSITKYAEKNNISMLDLANAGLISKNESGSVYEVFRNRVIFPIRNRYNKIVGFGGRSLDNSMPKYLNSPETLVFKKQHILYNENLALPHAYKHNNVIVVEGYMDCIKLSMHGFENVVATLGTAVNEFHILEMWKFVSEIIICMDGDKAGIQAAKRVLDLATKHITTENQISFLIIPDNMDPDQYISQFGEAKFGALLKERMSFSEMVWYIHTNNVALNKMEHQAKLENDLRVVLCDKIQSNVLKNSYQRFFKQKCWELFVKNSKFNKKEVDNNHVKNNLNANINDNIALKVDFNALDKIEYSLIALIIQNYDMLQYQEILEQFVELDILNKDIHKFKEYLLNQILDVDKNVLSKNESQLQKIVNQGNYKKVYSLFTNYKIMYNINPSMNKHYDCSLLWELLLRRHRILTLQLKYKAMISKKEDVDTEFCKFYLDKINEESKSLTLLINDVK